MKIIKFSIENYFLYNSMVQHVWCAFDVWKFGTVKTDNVQMINGPHKVALI